MAISPEPLYQDNMGIPSSAIPPPDLSLLYRDAPTDKEVNLLVWMEHPDPMRRRWAITWSVGIAPSGAEVFRILHLVQEPNHVGLTNWGPLTRPLLEEDMRITRKFLIARHLGADARQRLERIAATTRVQAPDGVYGTQHWVVDVLKSAVEQGIFANSQCRAATSLAWQN
ncbi:hypothetical protein EXIGLDRAFT_775866 [Exidia glandulosa HHB12029]|uniref:Uncharacterized protein n=1 Tax=Exidia glandulosa HHB12029 TaxID=1314781 RepID=A0A165DQ93_EXIGL|nr:hypothetical protein EXIGLDRAFT_775866 [Exidia glandulosa HHB12029]